MTAAKPIVAEQEGGASIGAQFCAAPLPDSVCADLCASMRSYPGPRYGTNLLTVGEAEQVLKPIVASVAEQAFRAGHAAAEEALGAHGSERLLVSIERAWADYAADTDLVPA